MDAFSELLRSLGGASTITHTHSQLITSHVEAGSSDFAEKIAYTISDLADYRDIMENGYFAVRP